MEVGAGPWECGGSAVGVRLGCGWGAVGVGCGVWWRSGVGSGGGIVGVRWRCRVGVVEVWWVRGGGAVHNCTQESCTSMHKSCTYTFIHLCTSYVYNSAHIVYKC